MAMDFPNAPILDQVYTDLVTGKAYKWDGVSWKIDTSGGMAAGDYVLKAGDTMGGVLKLIAPDPTAPEDAGHKKYIDESIAAQSLYQGVWSPAANTPDLTPSAAILHSYSWIAQTVGTTGEIPPAGLPGLSGLTINSADTVIWNNNLATYEIVRSPASASGAFLPLTGGTMTGRIVMGEGAGIHWGSTSAQTNPLLLDEGICLYGWGTNSKFGFSITSGTLNYVVENTANIHCFRVGSEDVMNIKSDGVRIPGGNLSVTGTINATGTVTCTTLEPRATTNVVYQNGFSGTMSFRTNPAMVSVMMHDVKSSNAYAGDTPNSIRICPYPAGVPAPWAALSVHVELYTDNSWGHAGRVAIIRALSDGIYLQIFQGGANVDYNANDRISCTLSWSR